MVTVEVFTLRKLANTTKQGFLFLETRLLDIYQHTAGYSFIKKRGKCCLGPTHRCSDWIGMALAVDCSKGKFTARVENPLSQER